MTLLITVFAAIVSTLVWYFKADSKIRLGVLCLMYWGASLMWLVDDVVEFLEIGAEYFTPAPVDMLNDAYLGLSVVALGLIIWLVLLLIKDPMNRIKAALNDNKKER